MKVVFVLLAACAVIHAADLKERGKQLHDEYLKIRQICIIKLDITQAEASALEFMQVPKAREEKCWLECIFTEGKLMDDGKYSRTEADRISEWIFEDDEENLSIAKEASKRCEKEIETAKVEDPCDVAAAIFSCLRRASKYFSPKKNKVSDD